MSTRSRINRGLATTASSSARSTLRLVLIALVLIASVLLVPCNAWVPSCSHAAAGLSWYHGHVWSSSSSSTRLHNSPPARTRERQLIDELEDRNSGDVANEKQYAVADGSLLDRLNTPAEAATAPVASTSTTTGTPVIPDATSEHTSARATALQMKMERMVHTRAYPLFLLEKGTEIVESLVKQSVETILSTGLRIGDRKDKTIPPAEKERIVVLGTGWGGASFLKEIDTDIYNVTVISPRNHFVFTPMLAGACVGTVSYRSICEPVRDLNRNANFFEATTTAVNPHTRTVTCEAVMCEGNSCTIDSFDVPYDRLLVTVGAQTNTYGIPGVREHCNFLKSVQDARRIRGAIVNCFERANLPNLTDEERTRDLTFAVIGAGPTGIEFAAELRDFIEQDGPKYYPQLLKYVRIKVIEASPTILAPFDKSLQEEAIKQMQRKVNIREPEVAELLPKDFELTELLLDSSVKEVSAATISLKDGKVIPYGLAVWAAGNGPIPLTLQLIGDLGPAQAEAQAMGRGRLVVDPWLRALGGEGCILALGDCACSCTAVRQLPATAQVAAQQGEYLAHILNKRYDLSPERSPEGILPPPAKVPGVTETSFSDEIAGFATANREYAKPFQFLNLGILAYTGGGSALAQVTPAPGAPSVKGSGRLGNAVWKSVYLSKQVSWRNRLMVLNDWTNRRLFGRDITRL